MHIILLLRLIVIYIFFINCAICQIDNRRVSQLLSRNVKTRCTRRYTPGDCAAQVGVVWTFVFQAQNCTERLGCVSFYRGNRFKTYYTCMRHCRPFIEMYQQMLRVDHSANASDILRIGQSPAGQTKPTLLNISADIFLSEKDSGTSEVMLENEHNENNYVVYQDLFNDEFIIFPPDIDKVDGEVRTSSDIHKIKAK